MRHTGYTDPYIALAGAIVLQAMQDVHYTHVRSEGAAEIRKDARRFLRSERCADILEMLDMPMAEWPKRREAIIKGQIPTPRRYSLNTVKTNNKTEPMTAEELEQLRVYLGRYEEAHERSRTL